MRHERPEVLDGGFPAEPGEVGQLLAGAGGDGGPVVDFLIPRPRPRELDLPDPFGEEARPHLRLGAVVQVAPAFLPEARSLVGPAHAGAGEQHFERLGERRLAAAVPADDQRQPWARPQLHRALGSDAAEAAHGDRVEVGSRRLGDLGLLAVLALRLGLGRLLRLRRLDAVVQIPRQPRFAVAGGQHEIGPGLGILALRDQAIEELRLGSGDGGHADTLIRRVQYG